MPVESEADRRIYLADFGVEIEIVGQGSPTPTFKAIPDDDYTEIDTFDSSGVQSTRPRFEALTSDVAGLSEGAPLLVDQVAHTFVRQQPDGTGMSIVILEKP